MGVKPDSSDVNIIPSKKSVPKQFIALLSPISFFVHNLLYTCSQVLNAFTWLEELYVFNTIVDTTSFMVTKKRFLTNINVVL